jgi:hypothetical protein
VLGRTLFDKLRDSHLVQQDEEYALVYVSPLRYRSDERPGVSRLAGSRRDAWRPGGNDSGGGPQPADASRLP